MLFQQKAPEITGAGEGLRCSFQATKLLSVSSQLLDS